MKKFILSLFFVIFALFNVCGEDLLHPVIRDDIDEDIKKIEQALVDYVLYPELVERGFDIHRLDNMKIDGEMFEYIESFFRPNIEKGWLPLDNHHVLSIKDENGKWFSSNSYYKRVNFSKEYGTKDELLKKGYVENETMFYYPSNGEKDWRVGEWSWGWYNKSGEWKWNYSGNGYDLPYGNGKLSKNVIVDHSLETFETKSSYVIRLYSVFNELNNKVSFLKKDYLILDISKCGGGKGPVAIKFIETIKKSKYKKILVITNNAASACERICTELKEDKRCIFIGTNTNGVFEAGDCELRKIADKARLNLATYDIIPNQNFMGEGIGILPDIWANNMNDVIKNIVALTKDAELFPNFAYLIK